MSEYAAPTPPAWVDDLLAGVERAFAVTGADTPGWPDPHPDRDPAEEEYSRCLDPGKYRILGSRLDAWAQVLADRGLAVVRDVEPGAWVDAPRRTDELARVRAFEPVASGGLTLLAATTLVDREPFGVDLGLSAPGLPTVLLDTVPDCGCDACDSGSADLLEALDGWMLTVARGGVVHARSSTAHISRTFHGWSSSGGGALEPWLDEALEPPAGVRRWVGTPWVQ